jgi:hypothetical protein
VSQQWEEYSVGSLCMYGNAPAKVLYSAGAPNERFIEYTSEAGRNFEWVTTENLSHLSLPSLHEQLATALMTISRMHRETADKAGAGS